MVPLAVAKVLTVWEGKAETLREEPSETLGVAERVGVGENVTRPVTENTVLSVGVDVMQVDSDDDGEEQGVAVGVLLAEKPIVPEILPVPVIKGLFEAEKAPVGLPEGEVEGGKLSVTHPVAEG